DSYDVVFVGSLLTHLPASACAATLRALRGIVRPDGLLIFSTQGESCLAHLDWYGPEFVAAADEFRTGVRRDGAAFVPYPGRRDYGITILTPRAVEALVEPDCGAGAQARPLRRARLGSPPGRLVVSARSRIARHSGARGFTRGLRVRFCARRCALARRSTLRLRLVRLPWMTSSLVRRRFRSARDGRFSSESTVCTVRSIAPLASS